MEALAIILLCLILAYIVSEAFRKLGLPSVLGPIIIGMTFGIPWIKAMLRPEDMAIIELLANIGQVLLLFFVGLEIDFKAFLKSSRKASLIAILACLLPMSFGYLMGRILGFDALASAVIGISLSVSAEAVVIEVLEEIKMITSKTGQTIIEAGVFDDIIGIVLITGLITFMNATTTTEIRLSVVKIISEIAIFATIIFIIRFLFLPFIWRMVEKEHSEIGEFTGAIIIAIFFALLATQFSLSSVVGAIIAGIIFRQVLYHEGISGIHEEKRITHFFEIITFGFFALFFFIYVGLQTDITRLYINPGLGMILVVLAFSGKMFGSIIGCVFGKGTLKEGTIIGWGMNTRGGVELIIAQIALSNAMIDQNIFSAIVFVTIVTSFISPIIFKRMMVKFVPPVHGHPDHKHHYKHIKPRVG